MGQSRINYLMRGQWRDAGIDLVDKGEGAIPASIPIARIHADQISRSSASIRAIWRDLNFAPSMPSQFPPARK